jgi:uncharacterized protein (UPF0371 family)
MTHYNGQSSADAYRKRLERLGIKVYYHYTIEGYPNNVALIDSDEGFGKNDYVETSRPLVVVTAPGPGSGKMAVCLSQLYHENKREIKAGYAKFETFPVWNLPLKHPVNVAYEAATADLNDVNMIDPFHLEAYGTIASSYNRDIEVFPVLNALFEGIYGESPYKSPTDMGVNMIGFCMNNEDVCCNAAREEIIRRYYYALCKLADKGDNENEVNKISLIMKQAKLTTEYRRTTVAAHERKELSGVATAAIELQDGTIITSRTSSLLGPSAALILNALKHLADIPHTVKLIPEEMIEPIQKTKVEYLHGKNPRLHTDEVLLALSICAATNPTAELAMEQLGKLRGCEVHSSVILSPVDEKVLKRLGINLTCEPRYKG